MKQLILSCVVSLIVLATGEANAVMFTPVDLTPSANSRLQNHISQFPEGDAVLGGVPFSFPVGVNNQWRTIFLGSGTHVLDLDVGVFGATSVHTLISTDWGRPGPSRLGIEFFGSDGAYFQVGMVGNVDIRDWNRGGGNTEIINGVTSINVFSVPVGAFGSEDRIDKQEIVLPLDFLDEELVNIRITDQSVMNQHMAIFSGATIESIDEVVSLVPEPSTAGLGVLSLCGLGAVTRRRRVS